MQHVLPSTEGPVNSTLMEDINTQQTSSTTQYSTKVISMFPVSIVWLLDCHDARFFVWLHTSERIWRWDVKITSGSIRFWRKYIMTEYGSVIMRTLKDTRSVNVSPIVCSIYLPSETSIEQTWFHILVIEFEHEGRYSQRHKLLLRCLIKTFSAVQNCRKVMYLCRVVFTTSYRLSLSRLLLTFNWLRYVRLQDHPWTRQEGENKIRSLSM